ncbi:metallophosphoesterase [Candidatus Micrarchaeota archaeon]|nr:metallophosphoesterase [Candidatus Micrarchaeota archaeon]
MGDDEPRRIVLESVTIEASIIPNMVAIEGRVLFFADAEFNAGEEITGTNRVATRIREIVRPGDNIVFLGDIFDLPNGSRDETRIRQAWDALLPFLQELEASGVNVFLILGNHDGTHSVASDVVGDYFGELYGTPGELPANFTLIDGNGALICMSGRNVDRLDAEYLRNELETLESMGITHVTIASHFPLDSIAGLQPNSGRIRSTIVSEDGLLQILQNFQNTLDITVVSGHQHVPYIGRYTGSGLNSLLAIMVPSIKRAYYYWGDSQRTETGHVVLDSLERNQHPTLVGVTNTPSSIPAENGQLISITTRAERSKPQLVR